MIGLFCGKERERETEGDRVRQKRKRKKVKEINIFEGLICDSLVNMFLFAGEKIYSDKFIQSHRAVSQC